MAFVSGLVYRILAPGQTLTIYGGFFDGSCSVSFGDNVAAVVDYDDTKIEVVVPSLKGQYNVTLTDGNDNVIEVGDVSVVELKDTPRRNAPKPYGREDFLNYVLSLMPRGNAFAASSGSNFRKLLTAIADSFKYTWDTIKGMVDSVDPTHTENLEDWERELNLPILGIYPETEEGRRAEIYRIECNEGGCTKAFVKKILSLMGIDADVYEYTKEPEAFEGVDFGDDDPRFFFKINFHIDEDDFIYFNAGESCAGDYLLDFTDYVEESIFNEIKQAHVKIIFGYEPTSMGFISLSTESGELIVSENDEVIEV